MTNKNELKFNDLFSIFISNKVFNKNVTNKSLLIFSGLFLFIVSFLAGIKEYIIGNYFFTGFITVFFTIPILVFFLIGFVYVILQAFNRTKVGFLKSYLVGTSIILPVATIGHILNILIINNYGNFINSLFLLLIGLLGIYLVILLIIHYKELYNVSGYRIFVSLILSLLILILGAIAQYLNYLLTILQV